MDKDYLLQFLEESEYLLSCAVNEAIQLKSDTGNKKLIHSIFRTLHSIKGNASILGFAKIKELTHSIEEIMDLIRQDKIRVGTEILSVLIQGIDELKKFIEAIKKNSKEPKEIEKFQSFFDGKIQKIINSGNEDITVSWIEMTAKIMEIRELCITDESFKDWERIITLMDSIGEKLIDNKIINATQFHTEIFDPKTEIEKILNSYEEEDIDGSLSDRILENLELLAEQATQNTKKIVTEAIGVFKKIVPVEGFSSFLCDVIADKLRDVELEKEQREAKSTALMKKENRSSNNTMRVNELKIDELFHIAGEFINIGETYQHIEKGLNNELKDSGNLFSLKKNNEIFNSLSLELQDKLSKIKRVSLENLIQSAQRIVYDINVSGKKRIKVDVAGEDILIDKMLLERLQHPFIHLVRNAADHGIESVADRKKFGKAGEGTIKIFFSETENFFNICITDDGKGINTEAVLSKAVEKEIISGQSARSITKDDVYKLLFKPGFTTLNKSNELSGRGVGLDIVNREISSLGGEICIDSVKDKGTSIKVCVPKKLFVNIMDGLIVKSAGQKFVLPISAIGESLKINTDKIILLPDGRECFAHHDNICSVIRLDKLMGYTSVTSFKGRDKIGVLVLNGRTVKFILLVDEILGIRQVVLKDIEGFFSKPDYVYGAAVLGNGNTALVIDLNKIKNGSI